MAAAFRLAGKPAFCAMTVVMLALAGTQAAAQVRVETRLEKFRYVAGEPIFVVADVTNVGAEPVAYDQTFGAMPSVALSVDRIPPRPPLGDALMSCYQRGFVTDGFSGSINHPPQIAAGASRSFKYLLTNYDLSPGRYELRASGRVNLSWKYYPPLDPSSPPTPLARVRDGQPVEGTGISERFSLIIDEASDDAVRAAFEPHLRDADDPDPVRRSAARHVIVALAPPFLEESIIRFTREHVARGDGSAAGPEALARLGTPRSRDALKELLRTSREPYVQGVIALPLAAMARVDDLSYLAEAPAGSGGTRSQGVAGPGQQQFAATDIAGRRRRCGRLDEMAVSQAVRNPLRAPVAVHSDWNPGKAPPFIRYLIARDLAIMDDVRRKWCASASTETIAAARTMLHGAGAHAAPR